MSGPPRLINGIPLNKTQTHITFLSDDTNGHLPTNGSSTRLTTDQSKLGTITRAPSRTKETMQTSTIKSALAGEGGSGIIASSTTRLPLENGLSGAPQLHPDPEEENDLLNKIYDDEMARHHDELDLGICLCIY